MGCCRHVGIPALCFDPWVSKGAPRIGRCLALLAFALGGFCFREEQRRQGGHSGGEGRRPDRGCGCALALR